MRFMTGVIAAILAALVSLVPGFLAGDFLYAILIGSASSFTIAFFSYSYEDLINEAPLDRGAVMSGNLFGSLVASLIINWSFWSAVLTFIFAIIINTIFYLLIIRTIYGTVGKALDSLHKKE